MTKIIKVKTRAGGEPALVWAFKLSKSELERGGFDSGGGLMLAPWLIPGPVGASS